MSGAQTHPANGYEVIQHHRDRILDAVGRVRAVAQSLELHETVDALDALRARVASDTFKVLVLGEFRRGKSTVINALLGHKVLPALAVPTTATINEVKWGQVPRAVLHARPTDGRRPRPREIPVEELAEHVVVGAEDDRLNPYERVEVFWPLELCEDGVELIDSPGLNDRPTRQAITTGYLQAVDAIVFVFAADQLAAMTELEVIDKLLVPLGHDHLFFVVNRINLIEPDERQVVIDRGTRRIAHKTALGADGVFFVDARGALEARVAGDARAFADSGFATLERELERFLARDRGKMKILAPATEVQRTLRDLAQREIPDRETMLAQSLEVLEARVDEAQQPLRDLEVKREQTLRGLDARIHGIRVEVVNAARAFYEKARRQVPHWAAELEVKTDLRLFGRNEERMTALAQEVCDHLEQRLTDAFADWRNETLQPLLQSRLTELAEYLSAQAGDFLAQADLVRVDVVGVEGGLRQALDIDHQDAPALERILAVGGGLVVAGPGAAVLAASGGVHGLARGLLPQIAVGVAGLFVLGPGIVLAGLLLGAGLIQGLLGLEKVKEKAQAKIGKEAAVELRRLAPPRSEDVGAAVEARLGELRRHTAAGLEREIAKVREEMDVVLRTKREGERSVQAQRRIIAEARRELDATSDVLHGVLADLVAL